MNVIDVPASLDATSFDQLVAQVDLTATEGRFRYQRITSDVQRGLSPVDAWYRYNYRAAQTGNLDRCEAMVVCVCVCSVDSKKTRS